MDTAPWEQPLKHPSCVICECQMTRRTSFVAIDRVWWDIVDDLLEEGLDVSSSCTLCLSCAEKVTGRELEPKQLKDVELNYDNPTLLRRALRQSLRLFSQEEEDD